MTTALRPDAGHFLLDLAQLPAHEWARTVWRLRRVRAFLPDAERFVRYAKVV